MKLVEPITDLLEQTITLDLPRGPRGSALIAKSGSKLQMLLRTMQRIFFKMLNYILTPQNFKSPSTWIASAAVLRILYVVLKQHGYLPKKKLNAEHVYLTGAGSGLGRYLAVSLA